MPEQPATESESQDTSTGGGKNPGPSNEVIQNRLRRNNDKWEKKAADMVAKAVADAKAEILDQLDADDVDSLKERLSQSAEGQSELTKAQRQNKRLQKQLDEALAREAEASTAKTKSTIKSKILEAAGDGSYSRSVYAELMAYSDVQLEDGNVTVDGKPLEKAMKDLLTASPHLVKGDGIPGGSGATEQAHTAQKTETPVKPFGRDASVKLPEMYPERHKDMMEIPGRVPQRK